MRFIGALLFFLGSIDLLGQPTPKQQARALLIEASRVPNADHFMLCEIAEDLASWGFPADAIAFGKRRPTRQPGGRTLAESRSARRDPPFHANP